MWWAAQCAAHAVRNRARIPGPSQAIDAKQVYSQQFRASEVHTWSTYSTVGPAPVGGRPEEWPEEANMRGIIIALVLLASPASARDFGQWENQPPLAPPSVRSDHPPVPGSQLPPIINEHQALIPTLPRSTLRRTVRMLELVGKLRRDVEDGRRKVSAVGRQLAHD